MLSEQELLLLTLIFVALVAAAFAVHAHQKELRNLDKMIEEDLAEYARRQAERETK
jgi:hypothetical protein